MDYTRGIGEYIEMGEYISPIPEILRTRIRIKRFKFKKSEIIEEL